MNQAKAALFTHSMCLEHLTGKDSPESPHRVTSIEEQLLASGLLDTIDIIECEQEANEEDVLRAHDADYFDRLKTAVSSSQKSLTHLCEDTLVGPESLKVALASAGCVKAAFDAVVNNTYKHVFCSIRPPGHHAHRFGASGFCILNNVAIGVLYALEVLGLKRIAILDFDAHHADGTEDILKNDARVELFSVFQEGIFPYVGTQSCAPNVHNWGLPAGSDGQRALAIYQKECLPILQKFQPEVMVIAAGFDAHVDDAISQLQFTDMDYAAITRSIAQTASDLCQGRVISVLEGGYNLRSLPRSVLAHVRSLARL